MDKITIKKLNEVYLKVLCEPSIAMELSEFFTFEVPGAKFMPAVRNKVWDGRLRLYNLMTQTIYVGLLKHIEEFCKARNYEIEYESDFSSNEFSLVEAKKFADSLNLTHTPRDYQINAFAHCVRENRSLSLAPTGSGKSLMIYLLVRYYNKKTLIIVPTTSLVHQLSKDFEDYGYTGETHKIFSGKEKNSSELITISTWQSLFKMPKEYFSQFDVVIVDEAHLAKSKSITSILDKMYACKYRFGFTGTLDGSNCSKLVLEGMFGPVKRVSTTSELIDQKHLSDFRIKALVLSYPDNVKQNLMKSLDYQSEMDFIVGCESRNKFIKNLTLSLKGNTLVLFQYVEKHGKILYDMILSEASNRKVFFIHGGVDGEERNDMRQIIETEKNAIIVASVGTTSTGINVKNLHNIIFASPSKSKVRNLQSIGRVLRTSDTKTEAVLFDIADDLSWKSKKNFTLLHFMERVKIYNEEKFNYKIYKVSLQV